MDNRQGPTVYTTGNSAQCHVAAWTGGEFGGKPHSNHESEINNRFTEKREKKFKHKAKDTKGTRAKEE